MRWDFFVNHYDADEQATEIPARSSGGLYPVSTRWQCAISAMVTISARPRLEHLRRPGEPRWAADDREPPSLELVRANPEPLPGSE
jgi:hypothetical protein